MNNPSQASLHESQFPAGFIPFPEEELNGTLVDRFESMVSKYPDNIVVTDQGKSITYRELNEAANRLAWDILAQRGDKWELIPFFAGYEIEAAIITWGILKTGKGYLVLNPGFPKDRLLELITEAGVGFMVTINQYRASCDEIKQEIPGLIIFNLEAVSSSNVNNPGLGFSPEAIPYINFTSGTTGKPKFLKHENRGLLEQQRAKINNFGLVASDRWAQLNPLSFGGGGYSFYAAMTTGGRICLFDMVNHGLQKIPEWLRAEGITVMNMPPPVFRNIFGKLPASEKFPEVRLILFSGDTMIKRDLEIAQEHFSSNCVMVNYLGLTEIGSVTRYIIDPAEDSGHIIPVGYAFDGVEVSIIDEDGKQLPPGQEGELVLTTRYLSGDPRLNAGSIDDNRFKMDPQTGWCVVRSGDLGRLREDGALEHLGRKDTVVKVRGLRIDTSEVEAILYQHESIQDAAVIARGAENLGELQIIAYVIPKPSVDLTVAQVYGYLSWKLPQYMLPNRYVFLDKLPYNTNGKVDRSQLPEPDLDQPMPGEKFVSPRNSIEWQLSRIWSDLLQVKQISIHDNFFTLGGHSLLALQLMERVEKEMKVKLPMQTLAKRPTLAEMGSLVAELSPDTFQSSIVLLREGEDKPALFFVPGGARTGISLMNMATRIEAGRKVYALEYPGMDGYLEPLDDIRVLAEFFNQQILSTQPEGPYHLAGPCLGGLIVFEMAQQLTAAGHEVGLLALLDSTPPGGESTWAAKKRTSQYYRDRTAAIVKTGNVRSYLGSIKSRLRRNKLVLTFDVLWKRLRYNFHKTDEQLWQDRRLDKQTWFVFDKLQVAKKSYLPGKFQGHGVVIFNAVSEGTPREKQWADLLGTYDVYYIPGTNHGNLFTADSSVVRIVEIIDDCLRGKFEEML